MDDEDRSWGDAHPPATVANAVEAFEAVTDARSTFIRTEDPADHAVLQRLDIAYIAALSQAVDAHVASGRPEADEATLRALPQGEALLLARTADEATTAALDEDRRLNHPLADYLVDWSTFWDADDEDHEWLLEPMFAQGRSHAIYAGAKTGKSFTVLAACAALATGRPWLGHKSEPRVVLYIDFEMTAEDIRDRLSEFGYGPGDDLSKLHYALLPSLPPLDTEDGGVALLWAALSVGAAMVVIDTTGRALGGEENSADAIRNYYRYTGSRLKREGITVIRLDHAGKDADRGQRGSSAKNDDVDVVWQVKRTDDGQRWTATHRRMSWVPERVELVTTSGADGITSFTSPTRASWPAGTRDCAADLDELVIDVDVSARRACDILRKEGRGRRADVVRAAVRFRREQRDLDALNAIQEQAEGEARNDLKDEVVPRPVTLGRGPGISGPVEAGRAPGRGGTRHQNTPENTVGRGAGRGGTRQPQPPRPDFRVPIGDAVGAGPLDDESSEDEIDPGSDGDRSWL